MIKEQDVKSKKERLIIEGKLYKWSDRFITGEQLKELAHIELDQELYLSLRDPWIDELIENEAKVDLARPGIERFFVKKELAFIVNKQKFLSKSQFITGLEIRMKADLTDNVDLFFKVKGYEDDLVEESTIIDLARPGLEKFYTCPRLVEICVNKVDYKIESGSTKVSKIREIGSVDLAHCFSQIIDGKMGDPLDNSASVEIVGGEKFVSYVKDGSSS